jgi:hypothetical protein
MKKVWNWVILALVSIISTLALWIPAGLDTVYQNFDGPYYAVIAKTWYAPEKISASFSFPIPLEYYPAHFPLYPALISVTGINSLQAMVGINLLVTALCAVVLYEIFRKMNLKHPMFLASIWLFLWPRMWVVRSVGSPETLFILFVISSLFLFQQKKYWLSAILGSLAVLTKSPGILLFVAYGLWFVWDYLKHKKFQWNVYPVLLIPAALLLLFTLYSRLTGDFWAYFNSGDNIHLQLLPFKVFDSSQPWVGDWWLDGIIWIYLVGGLGVYYALRKNLVWGLFGLVFYLSILFVSHRDIGRYALPIVPVVLLGLNELFHRREVRWAMALGIVPLYFYSLNFLLHNTLSIADWSPFL